MENLSAALESISFQGDSFFKALTKIVQAARVGGQNDISADRFKMDLSKTVAEYTNILILPRFITAGFDNAFVIVPRLTPGNILHKPEVNEKFLKPWLKTINSSRDELVTGWVDPKTSKVGGYFATVAHPAYFDISWIFAERLTAETVAAVILHEVGHAYTFFQFVADSAATNLILAQAFQDLTEEKDPAKYNVILSNAAKRVGLEGRHWVEQTTTADSPEVAWQVFATETKMSASSSDASIV